MERVDKRGRSKEIVLAVVKSKNLKGSSSSIGKDVCSSRIEAYVKCNESKRKQKKKKYRKNPRCSYDSSSSESSNDSSAVKESLSSSDSESSHEHCRTKSKQKSRKMTSKKSDNKESLSCLRTARAAVNIAVRMTSKKRKNGNRHHHKSRKNGSRGGNDFDGAGDDSILKSPRAYLKDPKMYGDFSPYLVNDMVRVSSETSDMEKIVEAVVVIEDSDGDETDDSQ